MSGHELLQSESEITASGCFVSSDIKLACVNVCGLKSKLKIPEFHEFLKKYCFICVSETKIDDLDIPTVLDNLPENYTAIFKNRYSLTNYRGGGIAIIFHERYAEHCDVIESSNEHVLCCHIRRTAHGGTKDILLGSVYIPPENSKYYEPKIWNWK